MQSRDLQYPHVCGHLLFVGVGKGRKSERFAFRELEGKLSRWKNGVMDDRGGEIQSRLESFQNQTLNIARQLSLPLWHL